MIRLIASLFSNLALMGLVGFGVLIALIRTYADDLPSHQELDNYQPDMLTRVYSGEGDVIAEFARERRVFVPIDEVPDLVKDAFISAEDKNFYSHPGIDAAGIAKAIARFAQARAQGRPARLSGASTITQQVMKNFLLTSERELERKIKEAILAFRVEGAMTKDEILELYLNDIFLGARSHGIVAAAENYFGKTLEDLTPEEAAYLAALPKAPSDYHPIRQYDRAITRRNYVLREMAENGALDPPSYQQARAEPLETILGERRPTVIGGERPDYFSGEVRRQLLREVGESNLYRGGLTVRATVDPALQALAGDVLREALENYDRAQGVLRAPVARIEAIASGAEADWRAAMAATRVPRDIPEWLPGVVIGLGNTTALVGVPGTEDAAEGRAPGEIRLSAAVERQWLASTHLRDARPRGPQDIWSVGDIVYVKKTGDDWTLRQIPEVQGAFMAMEPDSGRVYALQGGFSYEYSTFNRATQANRQPGSSFKPFVYAAALDVGYTPETIVLDAPISLGEGEELWRPKNSSGKFYGPSTLRTGLEQSRNLMTVRIAQAVGMDRIADYAERFGVYEDMPQHLSYALGAGETTLWNIVAAYSMFANGGKRVVPTVIDRVQDRHGETLYSHDPRQCRGCDARTFGQNRTPVLFDGRRQIMDPNTAFEIVSMLEGVVSVGTAASTVGGLGFPVAGKTGTTNDSKDAWFVGFTDQMVAGCFIGFDNPRSLGKRAYGGTLCGPVFKSFMREAMKDRAPGEFRPKGGTGVVQMKLHRETGERLPSDATGPDVVVEAFSLGEAPEILVESTLALLDDTELFGALGEDLPYLLPEGDDTPLGESLTTGSGGTPLEPKNVGLGTGGLY